MIKVLYKTLIVIGFIIIFSSCEKHDSTYKAVKSEDSIYIYLDGLMHHWYFWVDDIPELKYLDYTDPAELLEDYKVHKDKWSFIDKAQTITNYFEAGESYGFGFYLAWDDQHNLRVIIAYSDTDAYNEGVRRGWILEEIDDVDVKDIENFDSFFSSDPGTMKFKFKTNAGSYITTSITKSIYNQNAVFESKVFDVSDKKTGYISYQSFLKYSKNELQDAFTYLKSENIKELIVDLRYNSGGLISMAQEMADIIVPSGNENEVFYSILHNKFRKDEYDETVTFSSNTLNLNLNRVFFITNHFSASASELVINGLEPHMNVLHIGDTTSGKPYAMYGFKFQDWLVYPVTAHSVNANAYGEYENGIVPDKFVEDNHGYDWGDSRDPAIAQAINYIQYGNFDAIAMTYKASRKPEVLKGANNKLNQYLMIMDK